MTRTGKIARLPHTIREQLNRRLPDGELGKPILQWLNSLPEVKALLDEHFAGRPITKGNLTEWKNGGYRDWLVRLDARDLAQSIQNENEPADSSFTDGLPEQLAHWVALQYAATARALLAAESKPLARWSRLREISTDVSRLLRGHLWTERISLERERFDAHEQRLAIERQRELAERLQKAQSAGRILERLFSELKASEKTRRPKKNKPSREPADPASPPAPSSSADQSDPPSSAPEPGPGYQQS